MHLVPVGLNITSRTNARLSFSARVGEMSSDLVPASLANVLLLYLRNFSLTAESRAIVEAVEEKGISPAELAS